MADSKTQQIRDVYAHYGHAMNQAQNVEESLAILLAVSFESNPMTAWDYDARIAANFQANFKDLVTRFAANLRGSDHGQLLKHLEKAAKDRNELAHHYFWHKASEFFTSSGRAVMIDELSSIAERLELLDRKLSELTRETVAKRGLTKQVLDAITETEVAQLRSGAGESYRPERVPKTIEIVSAYEWRTDSTVRCALVLASREGKYLILGEYGLCFGPQNIPPKQLVAKKGFGRALPASVDPRPKASVPWNYGITLANGYVLRARPGNVNGKVICHFGLRTQPKGDGSNSSRHRK